MKDSQSVQQKAEMDEGAANTKGSLNTNSLLGILGLNIAGWGLVLAVSLGGVKKELSKINESIEFQNLLMLKMMLNAEESLPPDTLLYQDAQRLYVQSRQQGNSQLLRPVAYNK